MIEFLNSVRRLGVAMMGATLLVAASTTPAEAQKKDSTATQQNTTAVSEDFHVGDRIAMSVEGPVNIADTLVVRDGLILRFQNMGEVSLKGVKRSQVQAFLSAEVAKYVKNAIVRAVPLVQIGVLGAVTKPGYYSVPADEVLSDLLMRAGGPSGGADLGKSVIRRGSIDVMKSAAVTQALSTSRTIDELRLMSNDQLYIPEKSPGAMDNALKVGGVAIGLAGLLVALKR